MANTTQDRLLRFFSEGTVVAGLGIAAYAAAFLYEAGYLGQFGVPLQLVHISLDTVFLTFFTLSGSLWLILNLANLVTMFLPNRQVWQLKIVRIACLLLLGLWKPILIGFSRSDVTFLLLMLLGIVVFEFAWPVFGFRDRAGFQAQVEADEEAETKTFSRSLFGRVQALIGVAGYFLVFGLTFAGLLAYQAGKATAQGSQELFVVAGPPTLLVVRVYSDLIICVPYDRPVRRVQPGLILRTVGGPGLPDLVRERVGPLEFAKLHP